MRVKINQLVEGCILKESVTSLSNKPIIQSSTVLSAQTLQVLKAFLIRDVYVEPFLESGLPFLPEEVVEDPTDVKKLDNSSFYEVYINTVKEYKLLFSNWQAGVPIDISKIRSLIVPLIEIAFKEPHQIFDLHRYSTPEDYMYHHSVSVGIISAYLGKKLHYKQGDYNQLAIAGFLADCGMAKIDPKILHNGGNLSSAEYNELKQHPVLSYKMLEKLSLLKESAKLAVLQHHERIDGSGYFLKISGEQLHPFGKIVALADVYHAMCCDKAYRQKKSPFVVIEEIAQDLFGKFDVQLVNLLTHEVAKLSIGTEVILSNNQIAKVIFIDDRYPTRPMVDINGSYIQLLKRKDLHIERIIN
ncbi:HD-GYP domain-containing protein [Bacillus sp. PS06]|uniref:HD-GYP domain-containing protein n=1 Tax=Bacillus sp. PS06 TaxID=2764176 RepID=UPI00177C3A29|nr:HD-GYP domain-containing protein [Bacillus sp. PS06]MBD8071227.1 HD-GYP domain-containing protein [Bacillus sp. PS06]